MTLIDNWHKAWKMFSFWIFVAIGAFPDIYSAVVALGWSDELPDAAKWALRAMAVIGISARLIKQKSLEIDK